jgi:hypothetical protein
MALTNQQIVTLALQISKSPGYTSQAGQILNAILEDLAQTYDFDVAKGFYTFNFNPSLITNINPNVVAGSGPYNMPSDYLRADIDDVFWTNQGVPYPMIPVDIAEFDWTVQQVGNNAYPYLFAVDMSLSPPGMYVWPAPSGAYLVTVRYRRQMPDISTPEGSSAVPWFPNSTYLYTRLAGELCKLTGDDRWVALLGDGPQGAEGILRKYLELKDDSSNRAQTVKKDRRRFGSNFNSLPNTKTVGW